jgi:hypothetical protein
LSNFRRQLRLQISLSIQSFSTDISLSKRIVCRYKYTISWYHLFIMNLNNITNHQLFWGDFVMLHLIGATYIHNCHDLSINFVILLPSLIICESFKEHTYKNNPRNRNNTDERIISLNRRNVLQNTITDEEHIYCVLELLKQCNW